MADIKKTGNEVVVEIGDPGKGKRRRRGGPNFLHRGRDEGYFPRRLSGGITFYDLGQKSDGAGGWTELAYRFPLIVTTPNAPSVTTNQPDAAGYNALADEVFATDVADFETTFRRLDLATMRLPAARFVAGNLDDVATFADSNNTGDAKFSEKGLKFPESTLQGGRFFVNNVVDGFAGLFAELLIMTGTGKNKITAVRDYAAAAVPFTPGKSDKYFLMPALNLPDVRYWASTPIRLEYWLDDFAPLPRAKILEPSAPNYNKPLFAAWNAPGTENGDGNAGTYRLLDLFREVQHNPQAVRFVGIPGPSWTVSTISPAGVPDPTYWAAGSTANLFEAIAFWSRDEPPAGALLAVVKQGSNFFYVWA